MIHIESPEEMIDFGIRVGESIRAPMNFYLEGELGSGKTVFAKGVLAGLGTQDTVTSPTYLIAKEHSGARISTVHIDLFRIDSYSKFISLGLGEYFDGSWVVICEWADRISELPKTNSLRLILGKTSDTTRSIQMGSTTLITHSTVLETFLREEDG